MATRRQREGAFSAFSATLSAQFGKIIAPAIAALLVAAVPAPAFAHLQCAPYAREVSGVDLHGNAGTWWSQAEGVYQRGHKPVLGAVLAFKATNAMRAGHVAVVSKVLDSRHVLLNHANWTGHGDIQRAALAVDVSEAGDWSAVRVWHSGTGQLGLRSNPTFGFIYNGEAPRDEQPTVLAVADTDDSRFGG